MPSPILGVAPVTKIILEDEPLVDTNEAARILGTTQAAVTQMRVRNVGPRFVKLGRSVRYRPQDLRDWIEEHVHAPVQQPKRALRTEGGAQ